MIPSVAMHLAAAERRKSTYYASFLNEKYAEAAASGGQPPRDIFSALSIRFVPAAMSIFGNLGEQTMALLRELATVALPEWINPFAQPSIDVAGLPAAVWRHVMFARYKCLVAVAHANSLARTTTLGTLFGPDAAHPGITGPIGISE